MLYCMGVLCHDTGIQLHVAFGCELDSRGSIPGADGFFSSRQCQHRPRSPQMLLSKGTAILSP
jgi:hypothetical protein